MTKSLYEKPYESRIIAPLGPVRVAAPVVVAPPARKPAPAAPASVPVAPAPRPKPAKPIDPTQGSHRVLQVGRVVATLVTLLMVCLLGRIAQLQVAPPKQLEKLIGSQYSSVELLGRRATITDREGRIVATTGLAHRLYVDPKLIADPGTFPELVGYALDMDPAKIGKRLSQMANKRYVVLEQELSDEQWLKVETMRSKASRIAAAQATGKPITNPADVQWSRLTGLYTDIWMERQYPQGPTAGHIIGFVGHEGQGFEGAERMFDRDLASKPGKLGYLRDAGHRALDIDPDNYEHARDGKPIRLSIDITIQSIAESELAKACKEFGAKTGEMVIMDPHTGEIIAMANYPAFDPNEVRTTHPDIRRNRCVTDPFEPGSTFKPFIWALATQWGYAKPTDIINTDAFSGRALRDTHDHGKITWAQVLIKSSNKGMAIIGQKMGNTKLHSAVKSFGFGDLTNSGMPGESRGLVNPLRNWTQRYSPTSIPMGQEIAVTPLQLCRAFCVFANGGFLVTPTLLAKDNHDPSDPRYATVVQRVLTPATMQTTRDVMRLVVTEGTGRKADSKQYAIFGKTGTAQVARKDGKGYEAGAYNGVFVAGAPLDKPRLVIACVIHKPKGKDYYGGTVAAPAVMRTFEQALNYMGVKPQPMPAMAEASTSSRVARH